MPKTVIEKIPSTNSSVTVFKIGGTLGFHEKDTLVKLFQECEKRGIARIVMDFSELTSLGGGCAKIIREKADDGFFCINIAGASATTLKFLQKNDHPGGLNYSADIHEALRDFGDGNVEQVTLEPAVPKEPEEKSADPVEPVAPAAAEPTEPDPLPADAGPEALADRDLPEPDAELDEPENIAQAPGVICLGHDTATDEDPPEPSAAPASPAKRPIKDRPVNGDDSSNRDLKKKLVQYSTLLSITSDLNRITDRMRLVDTFLLITIAQVGVERAAFYQLKDEYFVPLAAKGLEIENCFPIPRQQTGLDRADRALSERISTLGNFITNPDLSNRINQLGFGWVAPVIIYGQLRALVFVGKPIKKSLDDDALEVLRILVRQAAVAYENSSRFDEESDRTLGLVQTLISLIEENTLARGNTALMANYSFSLAQSLHYPEERIRDLLFGIVLRDIGMIKVSDLIVRSPRELVQEEWEIIKRHPIDGAEMLRKMRFSDHAVQIVMCHHERFNGEGYPNKLSGSQIPLGARIVSVVESYGAMLQDRPTRGALTPEEALNTLKENWGNRYEPEIVAKFVEIIEEEIRTGERHHLSSMELFTV